MKETIHFYYTNDLHSHFEHWPQVATFMKTKKITSDEKGESSWMIDIGDHLDRVHPITEATMGKANVALMNDLGYDFATIGNNEGITISHTNLYHLYDDAKFKLICSNLECMEKEDPRWLLTSDIATSAHGIRVGFIGVTARFNPYYHLLGWNITSPYEAIEQEINHLTDKTDVIVLLSHVGINEDEEIAKRFPEIDVIIGGHTHHLFRTGEFVNETLLTAAGKHCVFVGGVALTWDHENHCVLNKDAYVHAVSDFPKDLSTAQRLQELQEEADFILHKKIVHTENPIEVHWFKETPIMKQLTEKMRTWTDADCAMLNAGLLIEGFSAGDITYKDVHHTCPHPINPCVVSLTGRELTEVVRASLSKSLMELELKGFGFRGEVIGRMIFANLDVVTNFHDSGEEYVRRILFKGKPLDPNRTYTVATADTFTFGRLLPEVAKSELKQLFLPEFIREILVQTLLEYTDTSA